MQVRSPALEESLLEKLQAEMDVLRAELDHQQRLAMIGTLAAGAVHEINNLLTPALAYAQLAQSQPDLTAKAIEQCVNAIGSATLVAQTLLGFTAPNDELTVANVRESAQRALACLGRDPVKDGIRIDLDVPPDLKASISPLSLQQVLLNLLINAVHVLRQRRAAAIGIHATCIGDHVEIVITDNGPGIPQEVRNRLFQPFAVTRETAGHGLGLWVCRRLVEAACGSITVASSDKGTAFTISLPAT